MIFRSPPTQDFESALALQLDPSLQTSPDRSPFGYKTKCDVRRHSSLPSLAAAQASLALLTSVTSDDVGDGPSASD